MWYHRQFLATGAALSLVVSAIAAQQPDAPKSKKPDLPLSVGRRVRFTTSKGSWMSLDVSPDGQTIGSIEGGKLADLVVLDKNPLEDIKNTNTIRFVMKNGRLYDGNTPDEVHPSKRALQHFVWQDGAPAAVTGTP